MLLQAVVYISLYLLTASVAAVPSPKPDFNENHLPRMRLPQGQVEAMKQDQSYPPGYIHNYVTFGEGSNTTTVPVVEGDPAILLDTEDGIKARDIAPSLQCFTFNSKTYCLIIYCWVDNSNTLHTAWFGIIPGPNPVTSNPKSILSSDIQHLSLNPEYNTGYNGWFPKNHECSNSNTMIYSNHYLSDTSKGVAYISGLQCNNCIFSGLGCVVNTGFNSNNNNLKAWSSTSPVMRYC
jgi:hypothetical protein